MFGRPAAQRRREERGQLCGNFSGNRSWAPDHRKPQSATSSARSGNALAWDGMRSLMASLGDQHQNRDVLLGLKEILDERSQARLVSLGAQSIASQVKELGSLETWRKEYLDSKVPNKKVDQITALERRQEWLRDEHSRSEKSLDIAVRLEVLPSSKKDQYDERLKRLRNGDPEWEECFVRLYTCAEWAFEKWAKDAGLDCIDRNVTDLYDRQDYKVDGRNVDVKTTISVGRFELKSYWSSDGSSETGEIICAVRSWLNQRDDLTSQHRIQGIFHALAYGEMPLHLKYFTLNSGLRNVCYFHSPRIFFNLKSALPPPVPPIDTDVIEYCAQNKEYLPAILDLMTGNAIALLRTALPPCHQSFAPIAAELMKRKMRHLLPHYLADHILDKILHKESLDSDAIEKVLWSVFEPSQDQKRYLQTLMRACKILPRVRCAHHPDEGIKDMSIEVKLRERKLILYARCGIDPSLKTTLVAYCWKTLEVLVYRDPGISVCDAPRCGCLTHMLGRDRIGRRTCPKYGDHSKLG